MESIERGAIMATAVSNLGRAELEREARNRGVARWRSFSLGDLRKAVRRAREYDAEASKGGE